MLDRRSGGYQVVKDENPTVPALEEVQVRTRVWANAAEPRWGSRLGWGTGVVPG